MGSPSKKNQPRGIPHRLHCLVFFTPHPKKRTRENIPDPVCAAHWLRGHRRHDGQGQYSGDPNTWGMRVHFPTKNTPPPLAAADGVEMVRIAADRLRHPSAGRMRMKSKINQSYFWKIKIIRFRKRTLRPPPPHVYCFVSCQITFIPQIQKRHLRTLKSKT